MQDPALLINSYHMLSVSHQKILSDYGASSQWSGGTSLAYDINNLLSNPSSGSGIDKAADIIAALDDAIASAGKLTHPLTVYRAVGDISGMGVFANGSNWRAATYLSTSVFWNNLHTHLIPPPTKMLPEAGILTIRLPKGTSVAYLGAVAHASSEAEVLLGRGHTFKIITQSVGDINNYTDRFRAKKFSGLREITLQLLA